MKKLRSFFSKFNQSTTIALVLAIIIALNYLLTLFPLRIDATANQRYSLSSASKGLVGGLDDLVKVKVFVSQKLPPQYQPLVQQVKDLLWEYQQAGRGNLSVEYLDPSANSGVAQQAQSYGIYPVQFSDISQGKVEVSQGYFGLTILYAAESESISFVEDASNLEYQITLAVSNLTRESKPTVAFVTGHQEKNLNTEMAGVAGSLRNQYSVSSLELANLFSEEGVASAQVLVLADPQVEFSDQEKYYLDQFLMRGQGVLFMLEGVNVGDGLAAEISTHQLNDFVAHYGVSLNSDLLLDTVCELASFSGGQGSFFVQYPFWPKITPEGFNADSVVVNGLESALFPWVSSLEIQGESEGRTVYELIKTGSRSWRQADNYNLNPTQQFVVPQDAASRTVAVLSEGRLSSYFVGKELPVDVGVIEFKESVESGRLIVVGDASFALDQFVQGSPSNYILLANMIDYLAAETVLTSIRSKGETFRPLKQITESTQAAVKYANMLGPSGGLLILGFVFMYKRQKQRER